VRRDGQVSQVYYPPVKGSFRVKPFQGLTVFFMLTQGSRFARTLG